MGTVDLRYRRATAEDVEAIVRLLADDVLASSRETVESPLPRHYLDAFAEIDADPNQFLCVAEDGAEVVGTLQLSFIRGLSRNGARRAIVEAVRVRRDRRGERIGEAMLAWAVAEARARECAVVQLTTDKKRTDAHRFYDRLGFEPSHVGYKLLLT